MMHDSNTFATPAAPPLYVPVHRVEPHFNNLCEGLDHPFSLAVPTLVKHRLGTCHLNALLGHAQSAENTEQK